MCGKYLVSYAASEIEIKDLDRQTDATISKNVRFDAYFVNNEKNTHYQVANVNQEDVFINLKLAVEKEGYLKVNNVERAASISKQEETLKGYLPRQLSEEEIRSEIAKLDDKSMPSIMKHFKANFAGKVDMSLVSSIARNL